MTITEPPVKSLLLHPMMSFIVFVALVVRLVAVPLAHAHGYYMSDERQYVNMAHRVLDGKGFVSDNGELSTIAPLYIFMLAGIFKVFGPSLVVPHVLGCILGTIMVILIALLSLYVFKNESVALMAAGVAAIYPSFVIYSGLLVTETLYVALFLSSFLIAYRMMDKTNIGFGLLLGLVSGLATLTRAVFFGFFPFLLLLTWWVRKRVSKSGIKDLLIASIVWCLLLAPWTIRNYDVHHTFIPVSTGGGKVLLTGNNPFAPQSWRAGGFEEWTREEAAKRGVPSLNALSEVELFSIYKDIALDYMVSHPFATFLLAIQKAHIFWVYPVANTASNIPVQLLVTSADFLLYLGAAIGLATCWQYRQRLLPIFVGIVFFFAVQVVFHAEARFRLPLVPFLCLLFGYAAMVLTDRHRRRDFLVHKRWVTVSSVAACSIIGVYLYTGVLFLTGKIS